MAHRSTAARAKGRVTATRTDVVAAATRVLDRMGLDALSMRAVAAELGVGVSTLYWHVRDKRELLTLIVEESLRDLRAPESGPWDARLAAFLRDSRRILRARPALVSAIWTAGWALGPQTLRIANVLIGLIGESGIPAREVRDAYFALVSLLFGFVSTEAMSPNTQAFDQSVDDATRNAFPALARFRPSAESAAMDRRFDYAIGRFIQGLRA